VPHFTRTTAGSWHDPILPCPALLDEPGRDDFVDLLHEAHRLLEGHHDLAVVGHIVVGEGAMRLPAYASFFLAGRT
jgi:hypothetical protein